MAGFKLKKDLLDHAKPEAPRILLCFDFGTAACKAAASIGSTEKLFLFELGKTSGDRTNKYPIASSLFLSAKNRLYFGHEAIRQSQMQKDFVVRRMDSMKSWMSQGDMADLDVVPVELAFNPTTTPFSRGDAMTMLLAFVLDMVTTQLHEKYRVRYVRRRFTRPVWDSPRSAWYDKLMARYLTRAQMVADTLSGSWKDGLPMSVVREVLDQVRTVELPTWLVERSGALEPIAAGVSRLEREYEHRSLAVVVDIGAGTTDMAALSAIQPDAEGEVRKAYPQGTPSSELNAGNVLDEILKTHILNGIRIPASDLDAVQTQAEQNVRLWKEQLFTQGSVHPTFAGGIVAKEVMRERFLGLKTVKEFEAAVWQQFQRTLDSITSTAKLYAESTFHPLSTISLIPAGGGARLPIMGRLGGVRNLGGVNLEIKSMGYEPRWFNREYGGDPDLFPKLAVAIGGASPSLPGIGNKNLLANIRSAAD